MCRWAGATRACCSDRLRSSRCIFAALRCSRRKALRSPTALLAFFNQMVFVQSRIAMLDIFALTFGLLAIAAFMHGFRKVRPHRWFALAGLAFGLSAACKWSGLFALAVCIVIVAVIRLMQGWRTQFADGNADDWYRPGLWPDFRCYHFAACFVLVPAVVYLATFVPLYGLSLARPARSPAQDFQRQHHDRDRGPHLYECVAVLAVSGAAGLVSVRQGRRRPDCGGGVPRQSRWCCGRRCRRSRFACATGS